MTELIDPQAEGQPKIHGYKKLPPSIVDEVNENKELENIVGDRVTEIRELGTADPRMVALAVTHLQQGFGWLNRALTQPDSRLK